MQNPMVASWVHVHEHCYLNQQSRRAGVWFCSFSLLPFDFFSFVFLQSAKMFNYASGWKSTSDALFVVFAVVFLVTRLIIFPKK